MRQILRWTAAAVMTVAMLGCAESGHTSKEPCLDCTYGYIAVGKTSTRKVLCIAPSTGDLNPKVYDCTKNPPECPECARRAKEKH
jgi:hypothetical protein